MKTIFLAILIFTGGFSTIACAQKKEGATGSEARNAAQAMPGQFVSIGSHEVVGTARIEQRVDGKYLVLAEDFKSSPGPDLRLVLRDSRGATAMEVLAPLKQTEGLQEYQLLLDDLTLSQFDELAVYCARFHVDFGVAVIR